VLVPFPRASASVDGFVVWFVALTPLATGNAAKKFKGLRCFWSG